MTSLHHGALAAARYLTERREAVLAAAEEAVATRVPRYGEEGRAVVRERLDALYREVLAALRSADAAPLLAYARSVADDRFRTGLDLSDVQAAFNACEESIWTCVFADGDPERYASVLPYASWALGAAKDALAQEYVRLASGAQARAFDLEALAAGLERP